jgi:hypothetical protein
MNVVLLITLLVIVVQWIGTGMYHRRRNAPS